MTHIIKHFLLVLSFLFTVCIISFSQSPVAIEDANFIKAQDLRVKLGLNLNESLYLEKILNRYNLQLREMVLDSRKTSKSFGPQYAELQSKRNQELRALLNEQQLNLFSLLEKSQLQDIKDYYVNLENSLSQNEEFTKYLSIYYRNHQAPIILKHKALLNQSISKADSIELMELRLSFNEILEDAIKNPNDNLIHHADLKLGKVIKTLGKESPNYIEIWSRIKTLSKRYSQNIKEQYAGINYHTREWNDGLKALIKEFMNEEKTAIENQMYFTLTQFGVSEKINRYVFLLFDVNDISTYFDMKHKVQTLLVKVSK